MRLIIAYPPENLHEAASVNADKAYMLYRAGRDGHLYRAETTILPSGGTMVLDAAEAPSHIQPVMLAGEIIREAAARKATGILADLPPDCFQEPGALISLLSTDCLKRNITLYVPAHLAGSSQSTTVLIETAISRGTLRRRLSDAISKYGAGRIALDIERIRMDFTLPSRDGNGKPLSPDALRSLAAKTSSRPFFSNELCTWYFNYKSGGKTHFVIFDDAESIRRKISLASRLGISRTFLFYPEVSDILHDITK